MITKMRLNPLDGFKSIKPSVNLKHICVFTVSKHELHFNKAVYVHFHGWQSFKFAVKNDSNGEYLALIKTSDRDPKSFRLSIRTQKKTQSSSYDSLSNHYLARKIFNMIKSRRNAKHLRFEAKPEDVYNNCIVFNLAKPSKE